ncbi:MAG: D-aminoacylase [Hungatella sp.]|nr:D-aminoacylase [Hungatella sp.]
MRTVILGGTVYDGSGGPPVCKDVLIENGRILDVGHFSQIENSVRIDAKGMAVTPGFIDSHRHGDFAVFTDAGFGEAELAQGVTTMLVGNCGMSAAPAAGNFREEWYGFIEPCLGKPPKGKLWETFPQYLDQLEKRELPLNVGALIGLGSVKTAVKGFSSQAWTSQEMREGQRMVVEALEAGAWGVSCGIMYMPECYWSSKDYIKLLRPAAAYKRPLCCHMRGEGDGLEEAVAEAIEIASGAGLGLHISHFKATGKKNWKRSLPGAIERIRQAREEGQDVTVDFYPYTGGSTTLMTLLPPGCHKEDIKSTLSWLSEKEGVQQLREELLKDHPGWENMVKSIGWERILISSVATEKNKGAQGRAFPQVCESGGDQDEAACMARLLREEKGKVGIIVMSMDPGDVDMAAGLPYGSVISDGLYGAPGFPHPRLYGAFPRVWSEYVIKRGILTPEEAVYKMSGLPARRFGLGDRGRIQKGMRADINLFNPGKFHDTATFTDPVRLAEGMDMVLINGEAVWNKGKWTRRRTADLLRAENILIESELT